MDFNLGGLLDGIKILLTDFFKNIGNFFGGSQISAGLSAGDGISGGQSVGGYAGIGTGGGPAMRPLGVGLGIRTSVAMGAHFSMAAGVGGFGGTHISLGCDRTRVAHSGYRQGVRLGLG